MSGQSRLPLLRLGVALVLLAVVLTAASLYAKDVPDAGHHDRAVAPSVAQPNEPAHQSESCQQNAERARERNAVVTGHGRRVVVIADSWGIGRGIDPHQTWPVYLNGEIHVDAFGGSAYSDVDWNHCGNVSLADRAPAALAHGADLVVVEGGLNDVHRSDAEIRAGVARLIDEVKDYPAVILQPPTTPNRGASIKRVDAIMSQMADKAGIPYIPTADIKLTFRSDGLHPDAAGHRVFGKTVARRIAQVAPDLAH